MNTYLRSVIEKGSCVFISRYTDPYLNMSIANYIGHELQYLKTNNKVMYLSSNDKNVAIGNGQNCWKECNMQLMHEDDIPLVRRDTGGGACYVDLGNRLFSFSEKFNNNFNVNYDIVLNALKRLNLDVEKSGRNDIIEKSTGRKISGSAFSLKDDIMKHHGTLLINADLDLLSKYLNPNKLKLISKGISSVRARVANVKDLNPNVNINDVDNALIHEFKKFNDVDCDVIEVMHAHMNTKTLYDIYNKFRSNEFIINSNPTFTHSFENKLCFGHIEILLTCKENVITKSDIFSDSLELDFIEKLKTVFIGQKYDYTLFEHLEKELKDYPKNVGELCVWLYNKL